MVRFPRPLGVLSITVLRYNHRHSTSIKPKKMLNDKEIRKDFINFLDRKNPKPEKIIEEFRLHGGNVIADVIAIYDTPHVFEIKGDNDKIDRVVDQAFYYNLSAPRLSLVTTEKHLDKAIQILPNFWGILVAKSGNPTTFSYCRGAKTNPLFRKELSLLSLWKEELEALARKNTINIDKKANRRKMAEIIASCSSKNAVISNLKLAMLKREEKLKQFRQE